MALSKGLVFVPAHDETAEDADESWQDAKDAAGLTGGRTLRSFLDVVTNVEAATQVALGSSVVGTALVTWLKGRVGRKVRVVIKGELEIEAGTAGEVEEMLREVEAYLRRSKVRE